MRAWLLLTLLAVAACSDSAPTDTSPRTPTGPVDPAGIEGVEFFAGCPADAPVSDIPAAAAESILAASGPDDILDDRLARASREHVPGGWGGLWVRDDGVFVMPLVDMTQLAAAVAAVNAHADLLGFRVPENWVVAVPARWTFNQLYLWDAHLMNDVWQEPELFMADRDEVRNRIVYRVQSEAARQRLIGRLDPAHIPCHLVVIQLGSPPIPT